MIGLMNAQQYFYKSLQGTVLQLQKYIQFIVQVSVESAVFKVYQELRDVLFEHHILQHSSSFDLSLHDRK